MRRALIIGTGPVAHSHAQILAARVPRVECVDPLAPAGEAPERVVEQAVRRQRPHVAVVAVPPVPALRLARVAARYGARVVLEKPGVLAPPQPADEDAEILLAHEAHQHPTALQWLSTPPRLLHAEVWLRCWRQPEHYQDWRARRASGGGLLHQQANQSLALLVRLAPELAEAQLDVHTEGADVDHVLHARLTTPSGPNATLHLRADALSTTGRPEHSLRLHTATGPTYLAAPLAAGVAHPRQRAMQRACRTRLHEAVLAGADPDEHPGLYPLNHARPLQTLITRLNLTADTAHTEKVPA